LNAKNVIVVGAGIVGLSTACRLAEEGYKVHIIEQYDQPGEGTSKANAGQLTFDWVNALGSPGFLRSLPKSLFDPNQGISATGLLSPFKWPWAVAFARQCTAPASRANTRELRILANRSHGSMLRFNNRHNIEFSWRKPGKIVLYQDAKSLAAAQISAEFHVQLGGRHQIIDAEECIAREPALVGGGRRIAGGLFLQDAEVGDCNSYCQSLAKIFIEKLGGKITFGAKVTAVVQNAGKVTAMKTNKGEFTADLFVIATGGNARTLLPGNFNGKKLMTNIKGISLTLPLGSNPPDISVTDTAGKFVIMRMGDKIRIAGYAFFSSNLSIKQKHVHRLVAKAEALMPGAADYAAPPEIWAGLRPATPDDQPMIGQANAENLYVNAGHGSRGWILAFGSAEVLLEKIGDARL
jgi:D-amino-acid dehydrogenase